LSAAWGRSTVALTGGVRWQRLRAKLVSTRASGEWLTRGAKVAATASGLTSARAMLGR